MIAESTRALVLFGEMARRVERAARGRRPAGRRGSTRPETVDRAVVSMRPAASRSRATSCCSRRAAPATTSIKTSRSAATDFAAVVRAARAREAQA